MAKTRELGARVAADYAELKPIVCPILKVGASLASNYSDLDWLSAAPYSPPPTLCSNPPCAPSRIWEPESPLPLYASVPSLLPRFLPPFCTSPTLLPTSDLQGGFIVAADLVRALHPVPAGMEVEFIAASRCEECAEKVWE